MHRKESLLVQVLELLKELEDHKSLEHSKQQFKMNGDWVLQLKELLRMLVQL